MQLATNPIAHSVDEFLEDETLVFTGEGGTFYVEPWVDGSYHVLRDASPARDGIVDHVLDVEDASLVASQKARGLC